MLLLITLSNFERTSSSMSVDMSFKVLIFKAFAKETESGLYSPINFINLKDTLPKTSFSLESKYLLFPKRYCSKAHKKVDFPVP